MIEVIKENVIEKSIMVNNKYLVLINGFNPIFKDKTIERTRNIFLIDFSGNVIWRVFSDFDSEQSGRFIDLYRKEGKLKAYRWDGGQYDIDIETGKATPEILLK